MITRAHIRRQLRKNGGIMNALNGSIGGGTIQGTPMGSRTGYWNPFKTIKKGIDKVLDVGSQVIKSPIGKAALIGLGGAGLMGAGPLGTMLGGVGSKMGLTGLGGRISPFLFGAQGIGGPAHGASKGILGKLGLTKGWGSKMPTALGGITAASLMTYFMQKGKTEEEAEQLAQDVYRGKGLGLDLIKADIKKYRTGALSGSQMFDKGYHFLTPRNYIGAAGGRVKYAEGPKKMNQDGLEFIVPVGQSEEKAFYDAIINDVDGIMSDERKDEWLRLLVPQLIESGEMSREEKKELGFAQGGRIGFNEGKGFFENLKSGWGQVLSGSAEAFNEGDQEKINEILTKQGWGIDIAPETIKMIIDMNSKGMDIDSISSLTETDSGTVKNILKKLNMKAQGGRIGYRNGTPYYDDGKYLGTYTSARDFYNDYPEHKPEDRRRKRKGKAEGGRIGLYAGTPEKGIKSLEAGAFPIKVKGDVRPENMKMARSFRLLNEDIKLPRHKLDFMRQTGPITDWQKEILENLTEEDIEYLKEKGSPFPFNIIEKIIKAPYIIRGGEVEDWAKGGRVGKLGGGMPRIPMGMPRVNAGGIRELDYRQSGGFVPMGVKEKADDVPAMLSKNEFVMTADAVRGAGGGSVEKGAQRMYDTMKRLEGKIA